MKIKEILVPQLQGLNLNNKYIEKEVIVKGLCFVEYDEHLICSKEGFFKYDKNRLVEHSRQIIDFYGMEKNNGSYIRIDDDDCKNIEHENTIYINEYNPNNTITNSLPIHHTVIHFTRSVLKITNKSNLEMIVETYENMPNKVYFKIMNDFSINSVNIRQELNTLISFLQK
jgi:hypothetical protein